MKRAILCAGVYLITAFSFKHVTAGESISISSEAKVENHISATYKQIDFGKGDRLSFEVFEKAYRGYMNLRMAGKLNGDKQVLSICDFTKSSNTNRFWIIDLQTKKVIYNTYVAHGQGSGDEYASAFSNDNNSHQSSLGFYVTGDTYMGEHGTSLRLNGMDNGFNTAAFDRGIVVHGAEYVSSKFAAGNQRIGRSWGCPAVPMAMRDKVISAIKGGTCLFIYYPEKSYLKSAYWVNKKIEHLPGDLMYQNLRLQMPEVPANPTEVVIQYMTARGVIDSSRTITRSIEQCN